MKFIAHTNNKNKKQTTNPKMSCFFVRKESSHESSTGKFMHMSSNKSWREFATELLLELVFFCFVLNQPPCSRIHKPRVWQYYVNRGLLSGTPIREGDVWRICLGGVFVFTNESIEGCCISAEHKQKLAAVAKRTWAIEQFVQSMHPPTRVGSRSLNSTVTGRMMEVHMMWRERKGVARKREVRTVIDCACSDKSSLFR